MNKKHTRVDEMIAPTLEGLTDRVSPVDGLPIAEVMVELGVVRDRQAAMTDTRLQRSVGQELRLAGWEKELRQVEGKRSWRWKSPLLGTCSICGQASRHDELEDLDGRGCVCRKCRDGSAPQPSAPAGDSQSQRFDGMGPDHTTIHMTLEGAIAAQPITPVERRLPISALYPWLSAPA